MTCEEALPLLSAHVDGELGEAEAAALAGHLAECAQCRDTGEKLRAQSDELRRIFAERRQVASRVAESAIVRLRERRRGRTLRFVWLPAVAALAAGFLLAILVFQPLTRPDRSDELARLQIERDELDRKLKDQAELDRTIADLRATGEKWKSEYEIVARQKAALEARNIVPGPMGRGGPQLIIATGEVEYQHTADGKSEWRPLAAGAVIGSRIRIRSGPRTRAEFRLPDNTAVRLNSETEIEFAQERKVVLHRGQAWSGVVAGEKAYVVALPNFDAEVTALGTEFDVRIEPDAVTVTVTSGSTRVAVNRTKEVVKEGELARIENGRVTRRGPTHDLLLAVTWVNELAALQGRDNQELQGRIQDILAQIGRTKVEHLYERDILALGDHCILPLAAYVRAPAARSEKTARQTAARLLGRAATVWAIPILIDLLNDDDGEVRVHMAAALERLTEGVTHGVKPQQWEKLTAEERRETLGKWRKWWEESKERYPQPP